MPLAASISAPGATVRHLVITVETRLATEFVDITAQLAGAVEESGVMDGMLIVQSRHTTAGVLINEHEPLLLTDLGQMFERLVPSSREYAHDDLTRRTVNLTERERTNGHAHCRAALLRTSEYVPIANGLLTLGRWQRVFLVDFDGSQKREAWVTVIGRA